MNEGFILPIPPNPRPNYTPEERQALKERLFMGGGKWSIPLKKKRRKHKRKKNR